MPLEPTKCVNGRMWPPGVSGNPNGRPVGSRTVFSQSFLKDLASVWAERGRAAMEKTGDRSARRLLCNLRQTDRPRGQADDRADASRQSKHGGLAGDAGDRRGCKTSYS